MKIDAIIFGSARLYAYFYLLVKSISGLNIPGLGFLLRKCRSERHLNFLDQKIYFNPVVASEYGLHIINRMIEPESHIFLNRLFDNAGKYQNCCFIEVGANIGAFLIDLSRRSNIKVLGFEPSLECVEVINRSMQINRRSNYKIYHRLVGDTVAMVPFGSGKNVQGASVHTSCHSGNMVQQIKLDDVDEVISLTGDTLTVLMVDVEGYELNVFKGGLKFIKRIKPLILFEYNHISKKYFSVNSVYSLIGNGYVIYRLRGDAKLDKNLDNSWNCVAVPKGTRFEAMLETFISQSDSLH
jgi:FkbM family methyltransferase